MEYIIVHHNLQSGKEESIEIIKDLDTNIFFGRPYTLVFRHHHGLWQSMWYHNGMFLWKDVK